MVPSGHLPVPDVRACPAATGGLSRAWGAAGRGAVGGAAFEVHAVDGVPADRHVERMRRDRLLPPDGDQLGPRLGHRRTGGTARASPEAAADSELLGH